jgi:predicted solute-binding protein
MSTHNVEKCVALGGLTLDMGRDGRRAIEKVFEMARDRRIMPSAVSIQIV